MILASNGIIASGKIGFDIDAQAFITAAGITDTTQKNAINQLVKDLKQNSIYNKFKAIYPFIGGTATTHKFNLKDPRDLDAAYRLIFNGGITHSSNGMLGAINGYADTKLNDNILSLNNAHFSVYSTTNIDALYCDGGTLSSPDYEINIFSKYQNIFYPRNQAGNSGISNTSTSLGLFMTNRVSSTEVRAFQNNTLKQITSASVGKANLNIFIGALNNTFNGNQYNSARNYAFASIGDGLSDSEATAFYNAVQTFQTTLGRQV